MNRTATRLAPALAAVLLFANAAHAERAPAPGGAGWEESGSATWYGGRHNGRRTSSGEIFDMNGMTAAHWQLPLGSKVRVTVQDTGASVVVTINDRQPYHANHVIDLSKGAAERINMVGRGSAMVTVAALGRAELGRNDVTEVAEAPAELDASDLTDESPRLHGRRHTHRGSRVASLSRPSNHAPSVIQVRRSVQPRAARHML